MSHECKHRHGSEPDMPGYRPQGGPPFGGFGSGGFGHGGWGGPRGPRARRGDIRTGILVLLAEKPMHGYQIIQEAQERSGGHWRPSPGSVYPTLQMLEDEGLISASEADGKRVFQITDAGKATLAERGDAKAPWDMVAAGMSDDAIALRDAMMQTGAAAMQAGTAGSGDQVRRVVDILNEARKRIYGILAEDAPKQG